LVLVRSLLVSDHSEVAAEPAQPIQLAALSSLGRVRSGETFGFLTAPIKREVALSAQEASVRIMGWRGDDFHPFR